MKNKTIKTIFKCQLFRPMIIMRPLKANHGMLPPSLMIQLESIKRIEMASNSIQPSQTRGWWVNSRWMRNLGTLSSISEPTAQTIFKVYCRNLSWRARESTWAKSSNCNLGARRPSNTIAEWITLTLDWLQPLTTFWPTRMNSIGPMSSFAKSKTKWVATKIIFKEQSQRSRKSILLRVTSTNRFHLWATCWHQTMGLSTRAIIMPPRKLFMASRAQELKAILGQKPKWAWLKITEHKLIGIIYQAS